MQYVKNTPAMFQGLNQSFYEILFAKPEVRRQFGKQACRCKGNIKTDIKHDLREWIRFSRHRIR
jgi:hypothetical protein